MFFSYGWRNIADIANRMKTHSVRSMAVNEKKVNSLNPDQAQSISTSDPEPSFLAL